MKFKWSFLLPKYWFIWGVFAITWMLSKLPYKCIIKLGKILGWLMMLISKRRRNIAAINIAMCFRHLNKKAQQKLLRDHFSSIGIGVMEVIISWWWPVARFKKLISCEGIENMTATDNGVLLLVMHFTTIELAGRSVAQYTSLDAVYQKHNNELFEYLQFWFRSRHDVQGKMIDKTDVRAMLKTLRNNRILWYAPDQDYGAENSVFVPFFGIKTATITATTKIAILGRADVIPMSFIRVNNGYKLQFHQPLQLDKDNINNENEIKINKFIEKIAKKYPEQYMWLHRRFKTRPEGEKKIY